MPGPDNIYVLTESVSRGWKQGVSITSGLVSGVLVHTTLAATGLSLIFKSSDLAYDIMKNAATAYLLYMAWGATKEQPMKVEFNESQNRTGFTRLFIKGFMMNVLNPKVTLFFIVLLPQFVTNDGWSPILQMYLLGLTFMVIAFITFSSIALVSGFFASMIDHQGFWLWTKWIKVGVLLVLSFLMVISEKGVS